MKLLRYFAARRGAEVVALQASPLLGAVLGGATFSRPSLIHLALLAVGSLAVTGHVFVFNDWAGYHSDSRDPHRADAAPAGRGISRRQVAGLAACLLAVAAVCFAAIGARTVLLGATIVALSVLYSCSGFFGKRTPIVGSLNHLAGGAVHFLLGYTVYHVLDERGMVISVFFGLVFTGGHLNQEVRDYEADRLNGIRTTAVAFGARRALVASLCTFSLALALLVVLAALGVLSKLLLITPVAWVVLAGLSLRELRRGVDADTAGRLQRWYRLLFAVIGVMLLFS